MIAQSYQQVLIPCSGILRSFYNTNTNTPMTLLSRQITRLRLLRMLVYFPQHNNGLSAAVFNNQSEEGLVQAGCSICCCCQHYMLSGLPEILIIGVVQLELHYRRILSCRFEKKKPLLENLFGDVLRACLSLLFPSRVIDFSSISIYIESTKGLY